MWSWRGWYQDATPCAWLETADPLKLAHTDVLVLVVSSIARLEGLKELWLAFWTGPLFRYIAAHQIARQLGPKQDLLLFQHFMLWHVRTPRLRYMAIECLAAVPRCYTLWVWNEYNESQQIRDSTSWKLCCKTVWLIDCENMHTHKFNGSTIVTFRDISKSLILGNVVIICIFLKQITFKKKLYFKFFARSNPYFVVDVGDYRPKDFFVYSSQFNAFF